MTLTPATLTPAQDTVLRQLSYPAPGSAPGWTPAAIHEATGVAASTVYPAMQNLVRRGMAASQRISDGTGPQRVYYTITPAGTTYTLTTPADGGYVRRRRAVMGVRP